ncbi:MAG: M20/M25/M40 family metallo-hydrolase [Verrucomicrobiales bacterium]|nr:M20/M25/M40 family metallo-hydrolase [Verrucomicrobiales bacterium]
MPESTKDIATQLESLREIVLANIVMAGEIPSPTFGEENLTRFVSDRFTESELDNISTDEAGNIAGIVPSRSAKKKKTGERNTILVSAHLDKVWDATADHTVSATETTLDGRGIADNSTGVAVLVSLPQILEKLGIGLNSDLLLLGTTRSFGRGDLEGMRFFLDHTPLKIRAGICLEGMQLGRLSFSSLGMLRGEILVNSTNDQSDAGWHSGDTAGAIAVLSKIVARILAIEKPERPRTEILLGSIQSGSGYNVPPTKGALRFEIRSEEGDVVDRIHRQIEEIVNEADALGQATCELNVLATRTPGDIGFTHPIVKSARETLESLGVKPRIAPSISDLSALLDRGIPGLTLGITTGRGRHTESEAIEIEPMFTGLAQLVSTLQFIDKFEPDEQSE